jgi:hypothetical protein
MLVEFFLCQGANIYDKYDHKKTLLHFAVINENYNLGKHCYYLKHIVKLILDFDNTLHSK